MLKRIIEGLHKDGTVPKLPYKEKGDHEGAGGPGGLSLNLRCLAGAH